MDTDDQPSDSFNCKHAHFQQCLQWLKNIKNGIVNYPQVERCRFQLFGQENISGDPPEPPPSWRDDCSLILHKEVNVT